MQLTTHFSLAELTRSETANVLHIINKPGDAEIAALRALCVELLEPLRVHLDRAIVVTSGFRCARLNAAVGGVANSAHTRGAAADIHVHGMACEDVARAIDLLGVPYDQIIVEHIGRARWLHVSHEAPNRRELIRIER